MAVIIPFKARPRADGAEAPVSGSARILLFTGVRYERHPDSAPGPAPQNTPSPQTRRSRRRA